MNGIASKWVEHGIPVMLNLREPASPGRVLVQVLDQAPVLVVAQVVVRILVRVLKSTTASVMSCTQSVKQI